MQQTQSVTAATPDREIAESDSAPGDISKTEIELRKGLARVLLAMFHQKAGGVAQGEPYNAYEAGCALLGIDVYGEHTACFSTLRRPMRTCGGSSCQVLRCQQAKSKKYILSTRPPEHYNKYAHIYCNKYYNITYNILLNTRIFAVIM